MAFQFKNRNITDLTLDELEAADWELAEQEYRFNEALKHKKFEKLKPLPELSPSFVALRSEIKKEIEVKKNVTD